MAEVKKLVVVPCKLGTEDPILRTTLSVSATNGATVNVGGTNGFTIPIGRGDIQAIQVIAGSSTIADLVQATLNLFVNGKSIIEGDSLAAFSSLFQNSREYIRIIIPEGALVKGTIVNAAGTTIPVFINFLYYNPYDQK